MSSHFYKPNCASISEQTYGFHEIPKIHYQDDTILVLYKPPSWFVHPPEDPRYRRGLKRRTCVQWLQDQHDIKAYPAHRLDAATEGILIFGKTKEATAHLNQQFKNHETQKTYHAIVRGWFKDKDSSIDLDLELDSTGTLVACKTLYKTRAEIELPFQVNSRFQTTRYSWIEVKPVTGRWHQIRRHMNRVAHPIIGDREHGDSHHNRFFRDQLGIDGLCLSAVQLKLRHPETEKEISFSTIETERWKKLENIFGISGPAMETPSHSPSATLDIR
jgi:tRNA pseudouridine65 synthase